MKLDIYNAPFKYVSDNTKELDKNTAFLLDNINKKYLDIAKSKAHSIIDISKLKKYLKTNIKIIGITGTNGKTTTGSMIFDILFNMGFKVAFQGTRGFFINDKQIKEKSLTTPMPLAILENIHLSCESSCEFFIMEVSSHSISQNRIEGIDFFLKIHTNITRDHIDYHKNVDNYIKVKNSFFADDCMSIINIDDDNVRFNKTNSLTYGLKNKADFLSTNINLSHNIKADIIYKGQSEYINSKLFGAFNLYNILAVIATITALTNKTLKEIIHHCSNFGGVEGRMQSISLNPLIIIDFAHTPDGMEKVFKTFENKNIAVVFGAGGNRDKDKRALMGEVADKYAKTIYITSDNPRDENIDDINKNILQGIRKTPIIINDRVLAIQTAINELDDDVLFILGKGDETYQEINGEFIPMSDKNIIESFLSNT